MVKKRVSAKEAAADIRAGMDDPALMKKYNLSVEGLQSLYDKLIHAGFVDLGEVEKRLRGILGAVAVSESAADQPRDGAQATNEGPKRESPLVNAQEAARDIRLGMNDHGLMEKYRLSFNGLQSLFDKLMSAGLITQSDLARRVHFDQDHTVDLREEKLSFRDALQQLGLYESRTDMKTFRGQPEGGQRARSPVAGESEPQDKNNRESGTKSDRTAWQNVPRSERVWYNNHAVIGLLLISPLFVLGLYGLFRNIALSCRVKAVIFFAWAGFATAVSLVFSQMI
jgi:hypothetical protein